MEAPKATQTSNGVQIRHPRRAPAHESVTLRHRSPLKSSCGAGTASTSASRCSTYNMFAAPSLIGNKQSFGESSNAERWFERSNYDVRLPQCTSNNSDPPFLLPTSSECSSPDIFHTTPGLKLSHQTNRVPELHPNYPRSSSSGDFRSVIDDLTIENKELKKRLRLYEKLQGSHLQGERLFEVRMPGLSTGKKRELEETLRCFTMSLQNSSNTKPSAPHREHYPARLSTRISDPSNTSHFAESAYASMSASGQASEGQSRKDSYTDVHRQPVGRSAQSNEASIRSYLHDIPEFLLPRHTQPMTERAKKKLVVRRLEHIFAGRGADGAHHQPLQQQEVSESAALADRTVIEAGGHRAATEGLREARIMSGTCSDQQAINGFFHGDVTQNLLGVTETEEHPPVDGPLAEVQTEQRPTRPLDLDPHRAQVATENREYMRHLGFSPDSHDIAHGWIYMNLLINMAQLHTLNVTSDFVRKAVAEYSDKLEMSHDGSKLRWNGGADVTCASSDSSRDGVRTVGGRERVASDVVGSGRRKRRRLGSERSSDYMSGLDRTLEDPAQRNWDTENKLTYRPLVFQITETDDEDLRSLAVESSGPSSGWVNGTARESSGHVTHGMEIPRPRSKREDGLIIFYNRAAFCTDLSGDAKMDAQNPFNDISYNRHSSKVIGLARPCPDLHATAHDLSSRGRLIDVSASPDAMYIDDINTPALSFPPFSDPGIGHTSFESQMCDFEASGVGGVKPADHFEVHVQIRRNVTGQHRQTGYRSIRKISHQVTAVLPNHRKTLGAGHAQAVYTHVREEIVCTDVKELAPSTLPRPNFFFAAEDDEDDMDSDSLSISSAGWSADRASAMAYEPVENSAYSSQSRRGGDRSPENNLDGAETESLDFLATAREVDPEAVRNREREFDCTVTDRLAEEMPPGSSWATAGGGTGNWIDCPA